MRRWRGFLAVGIAAAALAGCGTPTAKSSSEMLREQRTALQRRIADDPGAMGPRVDLVRTLLRLGDGLGAEAAVANALAAGGEAAVFRPLLARAYVIQGDGARALATLDAGPIAPDMIGEAAWVAGTVHLARGNLAAARDAYDRAVRELPRASALWVDVARFRDANADTQGARDAVDYAIELDRGNGAALGFKANLIRTQQGLRAALPWYDAALSADADNVEALFDQAATLGDLGHYTAMLAALRQAAMLAPRDPRLYYLQAVLAARGDNYPLARSLLQRTRGKMNDQPGFMLLSAIVELQLGGEALAANWAERLLALQPRNLTARRLLAATDWADGDPDRAAEALVPIVDRADADSWSLLLASRVAAERQRNGDAATYQARAASLTRGDAAPFAFGARVPPSAAVDADPLNPAKVIPAIAADIAGGQTARAIARAERLRDANRGVADAHMLLGDAALAGAHYDVAIRSYRAAQVLDAGERTTLRLAHALYKSGDPAGSGAAIMALRDSQPSNIAADRLAGHLAMDIERWDDAIVHFDRVRRRTGNRDAVVLRELARAWAAKGDGDRALPLIALAYRLQPLNADNMLIYANLLDRRGNRQAAADLRDKAAQIGR